MIHDFIGIAEAAEKSGVTPTAIWRAVERGVIIGGRIASKRYVSLQSLEAYKPREYPRDGEKQETELKEV